MASSRASWMFTDPYVYQYSDINPEHGVFESKVSAGSDPCELEGCTPTDTPRCGLPADQLIKAVHDNHQIPKPSSPCGLDRSRVSISRKSVRYSNRREHLSVSMAGPHTSMSPQHSVLGLKPVGESTHMPAQSSVPDVIAPHQWARPSPPAYAAGLMPVDENATTPKEPSSDFDAILRNIGPISKKGKGNIGRERSSRYCDRYSSNFG
ncbi:hypothetical protein EV127DRAFT_477382 [Xylaria flabelliformis]|nr:hypothetical protein EV127DRAFT_477382 [Xylaria flabelliformis]